MNCSKMMFCTESVPGNKAWWLSLDGNCSKNSTSGPQLLAHRHGIDRHLTLTSKLTRGMLRRIDNLNFVCKQHSPSHTHELRFSKYLSASSSASVTFFSCTFSFSTFFELLNSFFQGDQFPSSDL